MVERCVVGLADLRILIDVMSDTSHVPMEPYVVPVPGTAEFAKVTQLPSGLSAMQVSIASLSSCVVAGAKVASAVSR